MCSWYEASATATKGDTSADQMTDSFQAHKDVVQFLSQAREDCPALYVQCFWVYCLHPSVDFLEFFPRNRNHHHFSDDVGCHELSFAIAKSATAKLKMKMLPAGFPVALCDIAIQSCNRHSDRSFLLLRIADFCR